MEKHRFALKFMVALGIMSLGAFENVGATTAPIQLVTMNVQCFTGDWQFRLSQILDKFIELSPEVIGLQEVCEDKVNQQSQIEFIRNYLATREAMPRYNLQGLEAQFTHPAWGKYEESLVLLTKMRVSEVDKGLLPVSLLQRGYVAFLIDQVWYINTHLEYKSENAPARKAQIDFLMERFAGTKHIMGGDFNSSPDSEDQAQLKQKGYFDVFPGDSHLGSDGNSSARIDGFWISPEFMKTITAVSGEVFLNRPVRDQYLSDHFAVRAWLKF